MAHRLFARFARFAGAALEQVDRMIAEVENHEALAECRLRDARIRVAGARVELWRVQEDGKALQRRLSDFRQQASDWRTRAAEEPDDAHALECLRRARALSLSIRELELCASAHAVGEQELVRQLARLERFLAETEERVAELRAREANAALLGEVAQLPAAADRLFEAWELELCAAESRAAVLEAAASSGETEWERTEREIELHRELAEIRRQHARDTD